MNSNISVKNGYELSEQIGKEVILRFEKDEYGSCSIISVSYTHLRAHET